MTQWQIIDSQDPRGRQLADRHYSRRTVGAARFTPPGSPLCLWQPGAVWVTLLQHPEFVDHAWPGAWVCSLFRNEAAGLSSELIIEATAITRAELGEPPEQGIITFIDGPKVRSTNPGYCYLMAGWEHLGWTKGGHGRNSQRVLWLRPERWPEPTLAYTPQQRLFAEAM